MNKVVKDFADFYGDLDALIAESILPDLAPGDITARMVQDRKGCHHEQARVALKRWQAEGKVEYIGKRKGPRGQAVDAWRMTGKI